MKNLIVIILIFPLIVLGQLSSEQQNKVDSLWQILRSDQQHDTTLVKSLMALDDIIYITNPELDLKLNLKIDSISRSNFNKILNPKERSVFLESQGSALNNLGIVYMNRGVYHKAIDYYTRSLKIIEKLGKKKDMAATLNNIGIIYDEQGDHDQAISYFNRSLKIKEKIGDSKGIATSLNSIGLVYQYQEKYELALDYFYESLKIKEKIEDKKGIATSLSNIGNIELELKNYDKAKKSLTRSLSIFEEIGDIQGVAVSSLNFGLVYFEEDNINKALEYGNRSLSAAQKVKAVKQIKEAAQLLWKVNKSLNNYSVALSMHELYTQTRDSLLSEENKKEIIRQRFKYEYDKQAASDSIKAAEATKILDAKLKAERAENKKNQLEAKQQKQQKYVLYGGLGIALIFGGFIFNRFRLTRKQNMIIENQKRVVDEAFSQLEEKNNEILDSINYAQRIQSAILPPENLVKEYLPNSFIFYQPKDIVAGDFYWLEILDEGILFAASDCTGHGVPGAMVSVVCNNALNRSVREYSLSDPGEVLNKTRDLVIEEFEKSEDDVKDGMDIALCLLKGTQLKYAGAHNPLWVVRNNASHIEEIKANKQPIGKFDKPSPYKVNTINLKPDDTIYIFSDGFADQFGGEKGKKYKSTNFKKLLLSIQDKTMDEQKISIQEAFKNWKGSHEQLDDVCIIGVKI